MRVQWRMAVAAAMFLGATWTSSAVPISYVVNASQSSISAYNANPSNNGLAISTALVAGLGGFSFLLNDGESQTFDFFRIWTDETTVNFGEDTLQKSIQATLAFTSPGSEATLSGATFGVNLLLAQWGRVEWGAAQVVDAGNVRFSVQFTDEKFNGGLFGLNEGECNGSVVKAKVTQLSSASVPDSGALAGMIGLAALIGFSGVRKHLQRP